MLDLDHAQLKAIQQILNNFLPPGSEIYAYGSRVKSKARRYSDLDLVIKTKISRSAKALIEEAYSDSDLPFLVDISNWIDLSEEFQQNIDKELVKIG